MKINKEAIDAFLEKEERRSIANEELLLPTYKELNELIQNNQIIIDINGSKTVELLAWQCKNLNPWQPLLNFKGKTTSKDYCKKELLWYLSEDLSIEEISKSAKIWSIVCSKDKKVNSNYGWCIFSKENYSQYDNVLNELLKNSQTRKATMIFTRPSMWKDYNKNGMSDFICTWGVHVFIRQNKLYYIINQRSCDIWFGMRNDFAFHCFVYQTLFNELVSLGVFLEKSYDTIIYNCDTLHLYERHFDLCKFICE